MALYESRIANKTQIINNNNNSIIDNNINLNNNYSMPSTTTTESVSYSYVYFNRYLISKMISVFVILFSYL